uniref:KEN domain-containing protein n=1 Tax=Hemiselmis tepida TaxID=464990 RepID=A0A7S0VF09_9CRYP
MVQGAAVKRPTAAQAHSHPFFWGKARRLQFLMDLSDAVEAREPEDALVQALERRAARVFGASWEPLIERELLEDLGARRKYDYGQLCHLLRAIRNKKSHYYDLGEGVRELLGPMPEGYLSYWASRFPHLLMEAHRALGEFGKRSALPHALAPYFAPDA